MSARKVRTLTPAGGEFRRVADKPFLEIAGAHFRMALKGKRGFAPRECLMQAGFRAGQQDGVLRQIEGIAVPVEHEGVLRGEMTHRRRIARGRQQQWRPADFLRAAGIDRSAERAGDELRAEADAERRLVGVEPLLDRGDFRR